MDSRIGLLASLNKSWRRAHLNSVSGIRLYKSYLRNGMIRDVACLAQEYLVSTAPHDDGLIVSMMQLKVDWPPESDHRKGL